MSKQFLIFLGVGLAVVAIGLGVMLQATKGNHLELTGTILKVRVISMTPNASLVAVDFRVTNPSDIPFVVKSVTTTLIPQSGDPIEGSRISKPDMDAVFEYNKLLGPKFNDVLSIKDKVAPHMSLDRMVGARFELPESLATSFM